MERNVKFTIRQRAGARSILGDIGELGVALSDRNKYIVRNICVVRDDAQATTGALYKGDVVIEAEAVLR